MTNDAIFPINFPERSSRANFLGGAAIATCCQRQGCISMSTEAELVALAACAIELICMMQLLPRRRSHLTEPAH
jgi:hypothetical protein